MRIHLGFLQCRRFLRKTIFSLLFVKNVSYVFRILLSCRILILTHFKLKLTDLLWLLAIKLLLNA